MQLSPTGSMGVLRRQRSVSCSDGSAPATISLLDISSLRKSMPECRSPDKSRSDLDASTKIADHKAELTIKGIWKEYCNSTAIHGVRYFAEEGRYPFEKVFWVFALALSLLGCCHQIHKAYTKWSESLVIVSFAETPTSVWQVPFPAVSICPDTKTRQRTFNFTDVYYRRLAWKENRNNATEPSEEELNQFEAVSMVCNEHLYGTVGMLNVSEEALETILEVAPPVDETMFVCYWWGQVFMNCTTPDGIRLFTPVLSNEGVCFTFNMLHNRDLFTNRAVQHNSDEPGSDQFTDFSQGYPGKSGWNLEDGYPPDAPLDTFPRRSVGDGLYFVVRAYKDDLDYLCRGPVQGFKLVLHNPVELPRMGSKSIRVPFNQELVVEVKPSIMVTTKDLRKHDPSRRQCYFPYERPLRFFKAYTQRNCEFECIANLTTEMCGCAAFDMPRSSDISICGPANSYCVKAAKETFMKRRIQMTQARQSGLTTHLDCHCLPACSSLDYEAQTTSQVDYVWQPVYAAYRTDTEDSMALSRLSIFFKDTEFMTSRRSEVFGEIDFLANCGGLLGLFTGFSLISLIEILYHASIRLWCNMHRRSKEHDQEAPQDLDDADHVYESEKQPVQAATAVEIEKC